MKNIISVIICTYNPAFDFLNKCIRSIHQAASSLTDYEILVIDNNSNPSITTFDFKPHLGLINIQIIVESQQGLTPARLRGIKESKGDFLIFVDDDNVLSNDYLICAMNIFTKYPWVGSFSGNVKLEYDNYTPPVWLTKYEGMLVKREVKNNLWGNQYFNDEIMPAGAGLCVRREVALHYLGLHESGKRKIALDRSGGSLLSGGDNDLAMCAIDIGLGIGLFKDLTLIHLIPQSRTTLNYIKNLTYGIYYSANLLRKMRNVEALKFGKLAILSHLYHLIFSKKQDREVLWSMIKAVKDSNKFISSRFE